MSHEKETTNEGSKIICDDIHIVLSIIDFLKTSFRNKFNFRVSICLSKYGELFKIDGSKLIEGSLLCLGQRLCDYYKEIKEDYEIEKLPKDIQSVICDHSNCSYIVFHQSVLDFVQSKQLDCLISNGSQLSLPFNPRCEGYSSVNVLYSKISEDSISTS